MPGVLQALFEQRNQLRTPEEWFRRGLGLLPEDATGIEVNEDTALRLTAVWTCVRILSETIGQLPLPLYRRLENGKGRERAYDDDLWWLLNEQPNPHMTALTLRETCTGHLALWGNAYIEIQRDNGGKIIGLWPLLPDRTRARRRDGVKEIVTRPDLVHEDVLTPSKGEVLHIPGLGYDGIRGYSPISYLRRAVALGLATEEFGARFFGGGARPSGVLEFDGDFKDDEAKAAFREQWKETQGGIRNAHRTAILEKGMSWKPITIPPDDAQFIETRKLQVSEIARAFRMPPHMVGDLERATYSNIEHQGLEFVTYTLMPWLVRWEQGINGSLVPERDRRKLYAEFLVDGLLRGDSAARWEAYVKAIQNGVISPNEARERENMNAREGGDIFMVPLNMQPAFRYAPNADHTLPDPGAEIRAARSVTSRRRTMDAHVALIEQAAARIIRREVDDVRRAARAQLEDRSLAGFQSWLRTYYGDHADYARRQIEPPLQAMAPEIYAAALDEIGEDDVPDPSPFVRDYSESFGLRHASQSRNQLSVLVEEAPADGRFEAVDQRLTEWTDTRPGKIATNESVRAASAFAKAAWISGGVTRIVWRANADACPLCKQLDGKTVGITQNFLSAGAELEPPGVAPLTAGQDVGHAPLHRGCGCSVSAG